ncbi:MAG: HD-GYP domain-containing protein [bacterium]
MNNSKVISIENFPIYILFASSILVIFFLLFSNLPPTKYLLDISLMIISVALKRELNLYKNNTISLDLSKIFLLLLTLFDNIIYSLVIYNIAILIYHIINSFKNFELPYIGKDRFPPLEKLQKEINNQKNSFLNLEYSTNIILFSLMYNFFSYIPLPKNIFFFISVFLFSWSLLEKIIFYLYNYYKNLHLNPYIKKFIISQNKLTEYFQITKIFWEILFNLIFFVILFYSYLTSKIYLFIFLLILFLSLQDKDYIENQILTFILLIIDILEKKDRYTFDHSYRVALISYNIAKQLNLDPQEIDKIYKSALIHDIGKILIPDEIINKKTKLTNEEFEIIKLHVKELKNILNPIYEFIKEIVDIAELHHERLDGKGYPYGYKQSQIPLASRILAIADTFDALIIDRPYRPGYSFRKAISILNEDAQKNKLDQNLVNIFIKIIPQTEILESVKKVKTMLKIYQGKIIENMVNSLTNFIDEII